MSNYSIFDIAGPIMVGPSSSHTAGACKIGQYARALFYEKPKKVTFYLHGSFAEVYKGHATDRALLAGVMRFKTSDARIKNSFEIAKEKKLIFKFITAELGKKYHPNTVKIVLEGAKRKMEVIGSSIGGGMIEIVKIDEFDISLKGVAGKFLSLVILHDNKESLGKKIINELKKLDIKIARKDAVHYKHRTLSVLSLEGKRITKPELKELEKMEGVYFMRSLTQLDK